MVVIRVGELFSHKKRILFFCINRQLQYLCSSLFYQNADYKKKLKLTELYL